MWGSNSWNHEIMTWAETESWTLNWLSHPGVPWPAFCYWKCHACSYLRVFTLLCPLPGMFFLQILARLAVLLTLWTQVKCTLVKENSLNNPTWNTVLILLQSTSLFIWFPTHIPIWNDLIYLFTWFYCFFLLEWKLHKQDLVCLVLVFFFFPQIVSEVSTSTTKPL